MKRAVVVGIAVAAVAVVGGGVAWWLLAQPPSPEQTAESYLRALSDGDFAAIEELLDQPHDLAQAESAFAGASSYISDYTYEVHADSASTRSVRAEVELGGGPAVVGFVLTSQGGEWRLSGDFLAELRVSTTLGDAVRVGDALAEVDGPVPLFPAVYPVTPAPAGILVGGTEAVVTNEHPVEVEIAASLSPTAIAAAQAQLDAYLDECARAANAVPDGCGLRVPWAVDLTSLDTIAFRIDERPVIVLSEDATSFDATGGTIVATATGSARTGGTESFTYRADDWAVRGSVRFEGDEMVLAVR